MEEIELMTDDEVKQWEKERSSGKSRYMFRNSVVFSVTLAVVYLIVNLVLNYFFSGTQRPWLHLVGFGGIAAALLLIVTWIYFDVKWERNERRYRRTSQFTNKRLEI